MSVLVLAEHDNAVLKDATLAAVTAATQLGGDVHLLVAGKGAQAVAVHQAELMGDEGHGFCRRPAPRAIARAAAPAVRCYLINPALRAAASMPS